MTSITINSDESPDKINLLVMNPSIKNLILKCEPNDDIVEIIQTLKIESLDIRYSNYVFFNLPKSLKLIDINNINQIQTGISDIEEINCLNIIPTSKLTNFPKLTKITAPYIIIDSDIKLEFLKITTTVFNISCLNFLLDFPNVTNLTISSAKTNIEECIDSLNATLKVCKQLKDLNLELNTNNNAEINLTIPNLRSFKFKKSTHLRINMKKNMKKYIYLISKSNGTSRNCR